MMSRKPRHRSQRLQADFLLQMGLDVLANALYNYRRQSSTGVPEPLGDLQLAQRADPRPAMHHRFRPAPRYSGFAKRRCKQRMPPSSAPGPHQPDGDVAIACRSKNRSVEFESGRQRHSARKLLIIQIKGAPCDVVGAAYPLMSVHRKKHSSSVVGGQRSDSPGMAEIFPKQAFFDGSRGDCDRIQNQRQQALVFSARHPRDVQHGMQFAVRVKNGSAGATELRVPAPKVLVGVYQHRTLLGNARANAVSSFGLLRPDAAHPDAPVLELVGFAFVPAMMNRYS